MSEFRYIVSNYCTTTIEERGHSTAMWAPPKVHDPVYDTSSHLNQRNQGNLALEYKTHIFIHNMTNHKPRNFLFLLILQCMYMLPLLETVKCCGLTGPEKNTRRETFTPWSPPPQP